MILWTTILNKIVFESIKINEPIKTYDVDIRYLTKWVVKFPNAFPNFIINNCHRINFNSELIRYEFYKL